MNGKHSVSLAELQKLGDLAKLTDIVKTREIGGMQTNGGGSGVLRASGRAMNWLRDIPIGIPAYVASS
jgi:hypothetical protein